MYATVIALGVTLILTVLVCALVVHAANRKVRRLRKDRDRLLSSRYSEYEIELIKTESRRLGREEAANEFLDKRTEKFDKELKEIEAGEASLRELHDAGVISLQLLEERMSVKKGERWRLSCCETATRFEADRLRNVFA